MAVLLPAMDESVPLWIRFSSVAVLTATASPGCADMKEKRASALLSTAEGRSIR